MTNCREEFESYTSSTSGEDALDIDEDGEYTDIETSVCWHVWQAAWVASKKGDSDATTQLEREIARLKKAQEPVAWIGVHPDGDSAVRYRHPTHPGALIEIGAFRPECTLLWTPLYAAPDEVKNTKSDLEIAVENARIAWGVS